MMEEIYSGERYLGEGRKSGECARGCRGL